MKCRKNTESKNPKSCKDKNRQNNAFLCSECEIIKKSKFIKKQEARSLLSILGTKTPLSKASLVGPLLF